jgi:glucose/arabinose dehydrogenase/chitodextrinase
LPPEFEDTLVAEIDAPTDLAWTPDGRILVPVKGGQLWVVENSTVVPAPAIDLSSIMCTNGERALGGVAVHPDFATNNFIYLYYAYNKSGDCAELTDGQENGPGPVNRLSRFVLPGSNIIDPNSEFVLFDTATLFRDHHNGGDMEFGADGFLYVTVGDGGTQRFDFPQDAGRLLGKIVRLTDTGGIPPGNPYTGVGSARCHIDGVPPPGSPAGTECQEVFSLGLRNPFRFAFDPNANSTRFFINDVGQHTWEDISEGPVVGGNYGWSIMEGPCLLDSISDCTPDPSFVDPVHWDAHGPDGAAVTGGAFVPDGVWPTSFSGAYLYADYVFGTIYQLMPGGNGCRSCSPPTSDMIKSEFTTAESVVSMGFGPHGGTQALYYVTRGFGPSSIDGLRRIAFTGSANRAPTAVATADPTATDQPQLIVQFDGATSSDPDNDPLTFAWDFDSDGAVDSTDPAPLHTYTEVGTFFAELTVDDGQGAQDITSVRIDVGNTAPVPVIEAPIDGTIFAVGDLFTLQGSASDGEDGPLADTSLTWEVRQHHATHYHPFLDLTVGNNITLEPAPEPEDFLAATNSYLEVRLTATDSTGLSTTVSRNIMPRTVDLTFGSVPSGLNLNLDGFTVTTPATVLSWEAHSLQVDAPEQTDASGATYLWESWSDGGGQPRTITVPASAATYVATFQETVTSQLSLSPSDDATVRESRPDRNYGTDPLLEVDLSSRKDILLRFEVSGIGSSSVSSALLRVFAEDGSPFGGEFFLVTDTAWNESTVTWNSAPIGTDSLGALGEVDVGSWYEIDVTPQVTGDNPVSFRIVSSSSNGADYASKENPNGNVPELVITLGSQPDPDTEPPSKPGNLMATDVRSTEITFTWNPSSDNVAVTGYDIYRDSSFLASTGVTPGYTDPSVAASTSYIYTVVAHDAEGNPSDPSDPLPISTPALDTEKPSPPGNLTVTNVQLTQISLSWDASNDNVAVTDYDIYRDGSLLTTVGTVTTYDDTTVAPEMNYQYVVRARDAADNVSDPSNTVNPTTPTPPPVLTFIPSDDATIRESRPDRNYGGDSALEVDLHSRKDTLLRFDVNGTGGATISSATLRLYVVDSSSVGGDFHIATDIDWSESTVTWNSAPASEGGSLGSLSRVVSGVWYELDVTSLVNSDGPINIRISSTSRNGVDYSSKENSNGNAPELVITLQ